MNIQLDLFVMASLKYLGTMKGDIIKAIAVDCLYKWGEIRDKLGLDDDSLRPFIKELKAEGIIEERGSDFRVEYELWLQYKAYHGDEWARNKLLQLDEEREEREELERQMAFKKKIEEENHLRKRLSEWIAFKKLDVGSNSSHIYLKGDMLDSLLKDLIPLSKKEIIAVNPYVEKCSISDLLINASNRGLDVRLITQSVKSDYYNRRKKAKEKYHDAIKNAGIKLFYNESVHAKLFVLDEQVLTASSMNLYSESTAGKLWEAGIASTDPKNIALAMQSIKELETQSILEK